MNIKITILPLILLFSIISCNDKSVNSEIIVCDESIILDQTLYENSPNDIFEFKDVEIVKNCLSIIIQYGGGCGEVELKLIDSESVLESYLHQRNIKLSFKDDDNCKALVRKKLSFNLSPTQILETNKVILNLLNWEKPIIYNY